MKPEHSKWFATIALAAFLCLAAFAEGQSVKAQTIIYRASLESNKNRIVTVKKRGAELIIVLQGFAAGKPLEFKANGGGTMTCRTMIEYNSAEMTVLLSLGMPDTRARCAMMPSFISVEGRNLSIDEETLKKTAGSNAIVRSTVQKILGKIPEEEG